MKKVMIMGAGIYQVPLIKEAKKQGIRTIVVSRAGNYPGFALADQSYALDTKDEEAVLKAALAEKIDGICTAGTDVAVRTIGRVCREMNLCGIPYEAAARVTDKYRMKEAFAAGNVSAARSCRADSEEQALELFERMMRDGAQAVMIKAVDSSGSRGVTRVTTRAQARSAYAQALAVSRCPYVLAEEFLEGHEIGVDGFVSRGKIALMLPHEKFVLRTRGVTIPSGHSFPLVCAEEIYEELCRQTELAVRATGIDNCAFNADVLIKGRKAWVLEIGGRSGATGIPELISIYCGFSYYEKILRSALGEEMDFAFRRGTPCRSQLLFSEEDGVITQICQEKLLQLKKKGIAVSLDHKTGDTVSAVRNGADRIGQFVCESMPEEKLAEILSDICGSIYVNGKPLRMLRQSE